MRIRWKRCGCESVVRTMAVIYVKGQRNLGIEDSVPLESLYLVRSYCLNERDGDLVLMRTVIF